MMLLQVIAINNFINNIKYIIAPISCIIFVLLECSSALLDILTRAYKTKEMPIVGKIINVKIK